MSKPAWKRWVDKAAVKAVIAARDGEPLASEHGKHAKEIYKPKPGTARN